MLIILGEISKPTPWEGFTAFNNSPVPQPTSSTLLSGSTLKEKYF